MPVFSTGTPSAYADLAREYRQNALTVGQTLGQFHNQGQANIAQGITGGMNQISNWVRFGLSRKWQKDDILTAQAHAEKMQDAAYQHDYGMLGEKQRISLDTFAKEQGYPDYQGWKSAVDAAGGLPQFQVQQRRELDSYLTQVEAEREAAVQGARIDAFADRGFGPTGRELPVDSLSDRALYERATLQDRRKWDSLDEARQRIVQDNYFTKGDIGLAYDMLDSQVEILKSGIRGRLSRGPEPPQTIEELLTKKNAFLIPPEMEGRSIVSPDRNGALRVETLGSREEPASGVSLADWAKMSPEQRMRFAQESNAYNQAVTQARMVEVNGQKMYVRPSGDAVFMEASSLGLPAFKNLTPADAMRFIENVSQSDGTLNEATGETTPLPFGEAAKKAREVWDNMYHRASGMVDLGLLPQTYTREQRAPADIFSNAMQLPPASANIPQQQPTKTNFAEELDRRISAGATPARIDDSSSAEIAQQISNAVQQGKNLVVTFKSPGDHVEYIGFPYIQDGRVVLQPVMSLDDWNSRKQDGKNKSR